MCHVFMYIYIYDILYMKMYFCYNINKYHYLQFYSIVFTKHMIVSCMVSKIGGD